MELEAKIGTTNIAKRFGRQSQKTRKRNARRREAGAAAADVVQAAEQPLEEAPRQILSTAMLNEIFNGIFNAADYYESIGCSMYARSLFADGVRVMQENTPLMSSVPAMSQHFSQLEHFKNKRDQLQCHIDASIRCKKFLKTIRMQQDCIHTGYDTLFERYITDKPITEIYIYEKDLSTNLQIKRLLSLLQYFILRCRRLKFVYICTTYSMLENSCTLIFQLFDNLRRAVKISCELGSANRSRIIFNNGYIFHPSVGLNFFEDEFHPYIDYNVEELEPKDGIVRVFTYKPYNRPQ